MPEGQGGLPEPRRQRLQFRRVVGDQRQQVTAENGRPVGRIDPAQHRRPGLALGNRPRRELGRDRNGDGDRGAQEPPADLQVPGGQPAHVPAQRRIRQSGQQFDRPGHHHPAAVARRGQQEVLVGGREPVGQHGQQVGPGGGAVSVETGGQHLAGGGRVLPAQGLQPAGALGHRALLPGRPVGRVGVGRGCPARILDHQQPAELTADRPGGRHHRGSGVLQQPGQQHRRQPQSGPVTAPPADRPA
jgi:hypothetical protein